MVKEFVTLQDGTKADIIELGLCEVFLGERKTKETIKIFS